MHLIAFPRGIRYGAENVEYDLIGAANTPCPFRLPFAMLTDGALARRAITGVYIEFASAAVDCCMQRQHLTAPDVHTVEVVAATSGLHRIIVLRVASCKNCAFLRNLQRRIGWTRYQQWPWRTTNMGQSVHCGMHVGIKH